MTTAADRRERLEQCAPLLRHRRRDRATRRSPPRSTAGVDMVQLRDPALGDEALRRPRAGVADALRCPRRAAVDQRPTRPGAACRRRRRPRRTGRHGRRRRRARPAAPELLVGLSTHCPEQLEAGIAAGADQLSVGPVWETPTKPGRPATGLDYVRSGGRAAAAGAVVRDRRDRRRQRRRGGRGGRRAGRRRAGDPRGRRSRRRGGVPARRARGGEPWRSAVAASGASSVSAPRRRSRRTRRTPWRRHLGRASGEHRRTSWSAATRAAGARTPRRAPTLKPLAAGERPTAVTVGAIVAAIAAARQPRLARRSPSIPTRPASRSRPCSAPA